MRTIIAKLWVRVKPLALPMIAYVAVPMSIAISAGLIGFALVAALDVWGDIYFVNAVPVASGLIILVSLGGLWSLQPSSVATAQLRERLAAPYKLAKVAWWSLDQTPLSEFLTRQFGRPSPASVTSSLGSDRSSNVDGPTKNKALPLVHSVVWWKPINRHYRFVCSINSGVSENRVADK